MLLMVKSAPDTPEGKRALRFASDMQADIVLLQNAVYFAQERGLDGFNGKVFILEEDSRLRGLNCQPTADVKNITYDDLVDLLTGDEAAIGVF
jgi:sulfur relay protein TusB/DsrH